RHKLSTTEWLVLRDCEVMLMVPHIALQSMLSERLPVLCGTIIIFEQFIAKWKSLQNSQPHLKPFLDIGLQWAQKYYDRMQSDTYIIAMVLNPAYCMSWIKRHWSHEGSDKAIQVIKSKVFRAHLTWHCF
ncbi:uncharacterized protein F5147DRAFT_588347, partial [Suillus discolor]